MENRVAELTEKHRPGLGELVLNPGVFQHQAAPVPLGDRLELVGELGAESVALYRYLHPADLETALGVAVANRCIFPVRRHTPKLELKDRPQEEAAIGAAQEEPIIVPPGRV